MEPYFSTLHCSLPGGLEELTKENFDARCYVNTLLKYYSLDQTCNRLGDEVSNVQNALVKIVNKYYQDFTTVSLDVQKLTQQTPILRTTLDEYLVFCNALCDKVDCHFKKIQKLILSLHLTQLQILKEKMLLLAFSTLQSDYQVICSIQEDHKETKTFDPVLYTYLEIVAGDVVYAKRLIDVLRSQTTTPQHNNQEDHIKAIEIELNCQAYDECFTLFIEYVNVLHQVTIDFLIELFKQELKKVYTELCAGLLQKDQPFTQPQHSPERNNLVLHPLCYGLLLFNQHNQVRKLIRQIIMDPYIEQAKTRYGKKQMEPNSSSSSCEPFHEKCAASQNFLTWIQDTLPYAVSYLSIVFSVLEDPSCHTKTDRVTETCVNQLKRFQAIKFCVLIPLLEAFQDHFQNEFNPIYPDTFAQNFFTTHALLDSIMSRLLPENERDNFLQSKEWITFTTLWKTQTYEAQRSRFLISELKTRLISRQTRKISLSFHSPCYLEATAHLYEMIGKVTEAKHFISREYPKVLRCVAQMTSMYKSYILSHSNETLQLCETMDNDLRRGFWNKELCCALRDFNFLEQRFLGDKQEQQDNLDLLTKFLRDAEKHHLNCEWIGPVSSEKKHQKKLTTQRLESIKHVCFAISRSLSKGRTELQKHIANIILKKVHDALQSMRGIPSLFRMTDQKISRNGSTYIHAVHEALYCLFWLSKFRDESIMTWIDTTVDNLFVVYENCLRSVLSVLDLQEESLKRLHVSMTSPSDTSSGDLVVSQLNLDKSRQLTKQQLLLDAKLFQEECLKITPSLAYLERLGFMSFCCLLNSDNVDL